MASSKKKSARKRPKLTWPRFLALWSCTLLGGLTTGIGLFLVAQIQVILYIKGEVAEIGPLTRLFGKATFLWRSDSEQVALALDEIPEVYLEHTLSVGLWLAGIGFPLFVLILPAFLKRKWRRS